MGILLPPVTQVTTVTNTHLTLHHRNRSLDSALQKIPEVDVTPSPECENVVVVSTILSTSSDVVVVQSQSTKTTQRDELASLGSDDSGILCGSDSGSSDSNATRESSVEYLSTNCNESRESLDTIDKTNLNCDDDETIISECITKKIDCVVNDGGGVVVDDDDDDDDKNDVQERIINNNSGSDSELCEKAPKSSGMLRLLESKVFDVPMAMHYLFNSKEPGVLSYIVNKMFSFEDAEVDFYLPQLVCMYIQMHDVAEVIHRYLIHR